ncbi:MAG: M81 family metallopeptidase [Pseudomonadota bacterium]
MNVFIATLAHETSTFSPIPTDRNSFLELEYHRPEGGIPDAHCKTLNGYRAFLECAQVAGHQVYASTHAWAQPSGPCLQADYESLRDEILDDLKIHGPFDMVFFFLHGAQVAQGYDDCEGDLLARARAITGPDVFIGAELDLHANVSEAMHANAVLMACNHYPHIDFDDTARELYALGERVAAGEVLPVTHFLSLPLTGMFYTTLPLMGEANALARKLDLRDDVLSVSLIHSFMKADIPDMGAGVLVVTDGECEDIDRIQSQLASAFLAAREETRTLRLTVDEALDRAEETQGKGDSRPVTIADTCDNAGGGAGSDSTFILQAILERKLEGYVLGLIWDPIAAQLAAKAGVGNTFQLRLGGKTGPEAGLPLDVTATVLAVGHEPAQFGIGFHAPLGLTVALAVAGNTVVVNSIRTQIFSPTCFTDFGIEIASAKALVVKSTQHFYDQFAPISREVLYCDTPGALSLLSVDPSRYQRIRQPMWPITPGFAPGEVV